MRALGTFVDGDQNHPPPPRRDVFSRDLKGIHHSIDKSHRARCPGRPLLALRYRIFCLRQSNSRPTEREAEVGNRKAGTGLRRPVNFEAKPGKHPNNHQHLARRRVGPGSDGLLHHPSLPCLLSSSQGNCRQVQSHSLLLLGTRLGSSGLLFGLTIFAASSTSPHLPRLAAEYP